MENLRSWLMFTYHIILGEDVYVSYNIVLRYIGYQSGLLKVFTYHIVLDGIVSGRTVSDRVSV